MKNYLRKEITSLLDNDMSIGNFNIIGNSNVRSIVINIPILVYPHSLNEKDIHHLMNKGETIKLVKKNKRKT